MLFIIVMAVQTVGPVASVVILVEPFDSIGFLGNLYVDECYVNVCFNDVYSIEVYVEVFVEFDSSVTYFVNFTPFNFEFSMGSAFVKQDSTIIKLDYGIE